MGANRPYARRPTPLQWQVEQHEASKRNANRCATHAKKFRFKRLLSVSLGWKNRSILFLGLHAVDTIGLQKSKSGVMPPPTIPLRMCFYKKRVEICIAATGFILCLACGCQDTKNPNTGVVQPSIAPIIRSQHVLNVKPPATSIHRQPPIFRMVAISGQNNPIDGNRAFGFLQQICTLGPRITGSPAMRSQQQMLAEYFTNLGGKVRLQHFSFSHPLTKAPQGGSNLIVEWHPDRQDRILLCVHYDTRPQGDNARVPAYQRGDVFIGANDGASGVALLMELGNHIPTLSTHYGIDFLFVDAEEYVFSNSPRDRYFLGSEFFARDYIQNSPKHRYKKAVVLDMIGDRHLQIYQDRNSVWWKDTRPITKEIWKTAKDLGVQEFIPRTHPKMRQPIRDDHLMLHNVGKIPTCEIIDFDYPKWPQNRYWHTADDTPERCSAESLSKVGWVILEWLRNTQ